MSTTKRHSGHFQKGHDPRRHTFTREECERGFKAAEESIARRYPGCDPHFMMCAMIGSKPWFLLPEITALLRPLDDEEALALFGRD
jgi:hypothetical protein